MNNSHRLLFIVYYFEDPHSFVGKMQQQTERYPEKVNVEQAAEITGYSKNSLYQMRSRGQIPCAIKIGQS